MSAGAVTGIRLAISFSLVTLYLAGFILDSTDLNTIVG